MISDVCRNYPEQKLTNQEQISPVIIFVCKSIYSNITAALRDVFLKLTSELQLPVSRLHLSRSELLLQGACHAVFSTFKHWKLGWKNASTLLHSTSSSTKQWDWERNAFYGQMGKASMTSWETEAGLHVGWSLFLETLKNNPLHCRPLLVTEHHLLQVAGWSI